ncbi:MAG: MarR family transcriptional regulator [Chloroflexi bacterium]|nr:MarR family transcriptional regulator [Chloroflexota bacterium]
MNPTNGNAARNDTADQINADLRDSLVRLNWLQHRRFAQELSGLKLTVPQFFTLSTLVNLGGKSTMGQLAKATHQVSATMTGIIDRLVRDELVDRRRDDGDRRTVLVSITPAGQDLVENAWDRTLKSLDDVVLNMNSDDRVTASRFVDSLVAVMED